MNDRRQSFSRRTIILSLAFLLIAVAIPLYAYKVLLKNDYTDFLVYYRAAVRLKAQDWTRIYWMGDGASPFRYLPITLPLIRPFAELSAEGARMTWYFCQVFFFGLGFWFIHRSLKLIRGSDSLYVTALSLLFIFRFCLDTFTIGQVSSLLFTGITGALYFWMSGRSALSSALLLPSAWFKIGPGFLYFLFLASRRRALLKSWFTALAGTLLVAGASTLWLKLISAPAIALWKDWVMIVLNDSVYYDASHYGSQSLKSALLRFVKYGILTATQSSAIYVSTTLIVCASVALFWLMRRPRTTHARGLFFSLGIFPYLWFMPETFKYSMTTLAVPVALLFSAPKRANPDRLTSLALLSGFVTMSLAGKDLIGDTLFFGMQKASLPLFSTFLLAAAVLRHAIGASTPSSFSRKVRAILAPPPPGPWSRLPETHASFETSLLLPIPLDQDVRFAPSSLSRYVSDIRTLFDSHWKNSWEILLIPFGDRVSVLHPAWVEAQKLAEKFPEISLLPAPTTEREGRAVALREGFLSSKGKRIFFGNIEHPCDARFFIEASSLLAQGKSLVLANRRDPRTRFRVPVRYLSLVYRRHGMGVVFNRLVRSILPITTQDTHAGSLALTRQAAMLAFLKQSAADFLFDLEIALTVHAHGLAQADLPITLHLAREKSRRRLFQETLTILLNLPRLALRYKKGGYGSVSAKNAAIIPAITADDWGISPGVNQGILELARLGVVRRTSAMAYGRFFKNGLPELLALQKAGKIEIGLHFDLTFEKSSPGRVLLQWLWPWADKKSLNANAKAEFQKQLRILQDAGIQPNYVDGHHHIHLVPGILDAIAPELHATKIQAVRLPYDPKLWFTAKFPLLLLCLAAKRRFQKQGFRFLPCVYPGFAQFQDPAWLQRSIEDAGNSEVIVHPAHLDDFRSLGIADPYATERVTEFRALRMLSLCGGQRA